MAEEIRDPKTLAGWKTAMERGVKCTGFSGYGDFDYKPSTDKGKPREGTYQL